MGSVLVAKMTTFQLKDLRRAKVHKNDMQYHALAVLLSIATNNLLDSDKTGLGETVSRIILKTKN